jgi:chromosome partitioning protein
MLEINNFKDNFMDPKMSVKDAARVLGLAPKNLIKQLAAENLPYLKRKGVEYFDHNTSRKLFKHSIEPRAISFQIVKGGTGKTSLATSFAIRASLYGFRVLCIDLDQQGNMSHSFGVDAETLPVMVDILAEGYSYNQAITNVLPGIDLIASRIENALIDDVIKLKKYPLDKVYREPFNKLKERYDLIIVDCPPNLGQSVAAITLAVDQVIAPVVPENFALAGLKATSNAIIELQASYHNRVQLSVVMNKYDPKVALCHDAYAALISHPVYNKRMLETIIGLYQEFPDVVANNASIFDDLKPSPAKKDIDNFTCEVLNIAVRDHKNTKKVDQRISNLEFILA